MLKVIEAIVTLKHKEPLGGSDGNLHPQHFAPASEFLTRRRKGKSLGEPFDVSRAHQAPLPNFATTSLDAQGSGHLISCGSDGGPTIKSDHQWWVTAGFSAIC